MDSEREDSMTTHTDSQCDEALLVAAHETTSLPLFKLVTKAEIGVEFTPTQIKELHNGEGRHMKIAVPTVKGSIRPKIRL
jgi:hypothetical protein